MLTQIETLAGFFLLLAIVPKSLSLRLRLVLSVALFSLHAIIGAVVMFIRLEGGLAKLFGLVPWVNFA